MAISFLQRNKEAIQLALSKLKDAHKEQNLEAIDTALAEINTAWSAASEEMYKATADSGNTAGPGAEGQQGSGPEASADGGVTDVDFEEVKDDKK